MCSTDEMSLIYETYRATQLATKSKKLAGPTRHAGLFYFWQAHLS